MTATDAELIHSVRAHRVTDYGVLYKRHVGAAYCLARCFARCRADADDLVSEAFVRVLDKLRAGGGPDVAFRTYLLTTLRHLAYRMAETDRRQLLAGDVTQVKGIDSEKVSEPFADTVVAGMEHSLAAKVFTRLPGRWQSVLWHTEIEGQGPTEVAPLLGLTPNGAGVLAFRAREGLRRAYFHALRAEAIEEGSSGSPRPGRPGRVKPAIH
jgi:RNA polymerase sigma factor (sigma-70 family)